MSVFNESGEVIFKEGFIKNFLDRKKKQKEDKKKASEPVIKKTLTPEQIAEITKLIKKVSSEICNSSETKQKMKENTNKARKDFEDNQMYCKYSFNSEDTPDFIQIFDGDGEACAYNTAILRDIIAEIKKRYPEETKDIEFDYGDGDEGCIRFKAK